MSFEYAAWHLMSEEDYGNYVVERMARESEYRADTAKDFMAELAFINEELEAESSELNFH